MYVTRSLGQTKSLHNAYIISMQVYDMIMPVVVHVVFTC